MKVTKSYLRQLIMEELREVSTQEERRTPVKKELIAILSARVGGGMDVEPFVDALTDEEAALVLKQNVNKQ